jgi:hypothetical protein
MVNGYLMLGITVMFILLALFKANILVKKKEQLIKLKNDIQAGKLKEVINGVVDKIKVDKGFEKMLMLFLFADMFCFALNWIMGTAQLLFTVVIFMLVD